MNKKEFETLDIKIIIFNTDDIIRTSGDAEDDETELPWG